MSLPKSYAEIATKIGATAPWSWTERRVTRSGVRRFLMAAYIVPTYKNPPWLRLWRQITWVRDMAKLLRIVIPPELWAEDKARLAAKIAADRTIYAPEERERALRWTRR